MTFTIRDAVALRDDVRFVTLKHITPIRTSDPDPDLHTDPSRPYLRM
jgi:hypothetical protein